MPLQEVRPLDGSQEAARTAALVSELSDAMRGILEVGAPPSSSAAGQCRPCFAE